MHYTPLEASQYPPAHKMPGDQLPSQSQCCDMQHTTWRSQNVMETKLAKELQVHNPHSAMKSAEAGQTATKGIARQLAR